MIPRRALHHCGPEWSFAAPGGRPVHEASPPQGEGDSLIVDNALVIAGRAG